MPEEVEVKLRLPDAAAHARLAQALAAQRVATHEQENLFFDGPARELNSKRVVLRLRFYDGNKKALLTLKGQQLLVDGIGRASEVEVELPDPVAARAYVADPSALLQLDNPVMAGLAQAYGLHSLVCLGGFSNTRQEIAWRPGVTLELDTTRFDWGCLYELEAETHEPEALRAQLEQLLASLGVAFSYSGASKFANFVNQRLD